jgi:uncharacterized membrane protein YbhN (UPF0104 family)
VTISITHEGAEPRRPAADRPAEGNGKRVWLTWAFAVIGVALAAYLIYRTLQGYSYDEIRSSIGEIQGGRLAMAFLFAGLSYFCLTFSDFVSILYVHGRLPYPRVALASFISLSLGHSIGFAGLSSGAIRYRFYLRWGLDAEAVTKLVLFCGITVALGLAGLAGIALVLQSGLAEQIAGVSQGTAIALGAACLLACAGYVAMAALVRRPFTIWKWRFAMPTARLALAQLAVGMVNFSLVAACLYQVLLSVADVGYFEVAAAYVLANVATLVTHVPGGLGVIESVVTYAMPGAKVLGAVLVFRFVYFLVPLAIGGVVFAVTELIFRARDLRDKETD